MSITVTLPGDAKTPGTAGHTADHNTIVDAITTIAAAAVNGGGDDLILAAASPATPGAGTSVLYASIGGGTPTAKLDSGYAGTVALGSPADHTSHTSTATTPTAITATWTIPASDAVAGTLYRLTFFGVGTWGSTAQALTLNALLDAGAVMAGGGTGQIQSGAFAVSTNIYVRGTIDLLVVTAGAGGTATVTQEAAVVARGSLLPGTAANNVVTTVNSNSTAGATMALDTTASHTLVMSAAWASATGAPTITGTQSYLERLCA